MTTIFIPATQVRPGDRVRIGRDMTSVVRDAWHTDNWAYITVHDLYYPLMIEPTSVMTVDRPDAP